MKKGNLKNKTIKSVSILVMILTIMLLNINNIDIVNADITNVGDSQSFDYTGDVQEFIVPKTGIYKLETITHKFVLNIKTTNHKLATQR